MRKILIIFGLLTAAVWGQAVGGAVTGTITGTVQGGGVAVPGASVTATLGKAVEHTVTNGNGQFSLPKLAPGEWRVSVAMAGFKTDTESVNLAGKAATLKMTLTIAPIPAAVTARSEEEAANTAAARGGASGSTGTGKANVAAAPAIAFNGSMQNAATSKYALPPAFGNNRPGGRGLWNGGVGLIFDTSALDAQPFSITGQALNAPSYGNFNGTISLGGPLIIPHIFSLYNAPNVVVNFERESQRDVSTAPALLPTSALRGGDLSSVSTPIINPSTGKPFPNNQIPVSAAAQALLGLYPLPNQLGGGAFNDQATLAQRSTQTSLQLRVSKFFNGTNQLAWTFASQSVHRSTPSLLGFTDTGSTFGLNSTMTWQHRFSPFFFSTWEVTINRDTTRLTPFFAGVTNVSQAAGIAGNDQSSGNWGPPTLQFTNGLASLTDGQAERNRDQTVGLTWSGYWNHGDHNFEFGTDIRWLEFNNLSQPNGRGTFTFNGAATGNAWADFLLGIPDGATLAYGNADKYLRERTYDAFVTDDWRMSDAVTLDIGARWEYWAPATELYFRLANIAVSPNFASAQTVVASAPSSTLTGATYPASLLRPHRTMIEPRLGLAWRPWAASSVLVRAGFGVYQDTSVYPALALRLAQQAPFANSLSLANSAATPLTLDSAFLTPASATANSTGDVFGVDPNFRPGFAQTWDLSVEGDMPGDMHWTLKYLGTKGSHAIQEFLPNTYAPGGVNPCPTCPSGFVYMASNGNSTYNAGTAELQRRFAGGFAATASYTYSHAIDDAALGGPSQGPGMIAQNWRDLNGERGPSSFDQRHQFSLTAQFSTGASRLGGAMLRGWEARAVQGWTLTSALNADSGLPLSPTTALLVPGTAYATVRPELTGAAVNATAAGRHLNPGAFALPAAGTWGNAGRNSIVGPSIFSLNGSLQRTFQVTQRVNALLRFDATNVLNHVTYPSWNAQVGSALFGLPVSANAMRKIQTTLRFTF